MGERQLRFLEFSGGMKWKVQPILLGEGEAQKLYLFVAENCRLGPLVGPPKKFSWITFWHSFPRIEAHKLLAAGPTWEGFVLGAKEFYVERVCCSCLSPIGFRNLFLCTRNTFRHRGATP